MNKLILSLCFLAGFLPAIAQKQYFIYLQSENSQPFYVSMGEKTFSSTASGYIILSKIPDSTIQLKIWFMYERAPQQNYSIHVQRKDHGYLIKHFGEKGWGLFDLQDLSVNMSTVATRTSGSGKASVMNTSQFAIVLSKAADDPSLMEAVVRTKQEPVIAQAKKEEPVKNSEVKNSDTDVAKADVNKKQEEPRIEPAKPETVSAKKEENTKKAEDQKKTEPEIAITNPGNGDNTGVAEVKPEPVVSRKEEKVSTGYTDPSAVPIGSGPVAISKDDKKEKQKKEDVDKNKEVAQVNDPVVKETSKPISDDKKESDAVLTSNNAGKVNDKAVVEERKQEVETVKASRPESITGKMEPKEKKESPYKKSTVTKKSEQSTAQGYGVVYVDVNADGTKDTVSIVIPDNKPAIAAVKEEPKEDKKFLDISSEKKAGDSVQQKVTFTNVCNYTANNNDFFKLRKDMAAAEGDEAMLALARKYFKLKCYTVTQVKSLGSLFLEDEGKYQFYDAVYRHTIDPENFGTLESELKDPYYVNRFKAMLRN